MEGKRSDAWSHFGLEGQVGSQFRVTSLVSGPNLSEFYAHTSIKATWGSVARDVYLKLCATQHFSV